MMNVTTSKTHWLLYDKPACNVERNPTHAYALKFGSWITCEKCKAVHKESQFAANGLRGEDCDNLG